ncbi:MAG: PKD domain-containing protein, partial [Bacteroidota bacterium]
YFDPRVIYDPSSDLYIMVVLNGSDPVNDIVVGFSTTSNPLDSWWFYVFSGAPDGTNGWFDYPSIGISTNDLYVSGNLFDANGNSLKTLIYQIEKAPGHLGNNVDFVYYTNVTDADGNLDFTVAPISYGYNGTLQPGIFFASTDSGGGSDAMVYFTNGTVDDNPELEVYKVDIPNYQAPLPGFMQGTTDRISTNDTRLLSGYYSAGAIHFVINTRDDEGWTRLYYGNIDTDAMTAEGHTFGLSGFEYAFPAIAAIGNDPEAGEHVIAFLRSSEDIFPEFRVVAVDEDGNWGNSLLVKDGDGFVNFSDDTNERWGDYTGITRQYQTASPTIWVAGCFGGSNNFLNTWIAEIGTTGGSVQAPSAQFTASSTQIEPGQSVTFTDQSTNQPTSWSWNMPGATPNTSTQQNPTVSYPNEGTFTVTLTATNAGGSDAETKTNYITVASQVVPPIANFSANVTAVTAGESITFSDLSTNNPDNWSWSFPGGTPTNSNLQNPTVQYNNPGTYNVSLTSGNPAGNDQEVKLNYITVESGIMAPSADFTASTTVITEGQSITFTDLSANAPTNWNWSFPGGNPTSSSIQSPTVQYNTAGTYSVTLTSSNSAGSDQEIKTNYITVEPLVVAPTANFIANTTTITQGESITFTDLSDKS